MQKYAEIQLTNHGIWLSVIVFTFAIGISYVLATFKDSDYYSRILYGLGLFVVVISSISFLFWKPMSNNNSRIILDAEKRIIAEDSIEPKQPQETTNTPLQVPENTTSKGQVLGKMEFIKAGLDLLKIVISGLIVAMLGLGVYYVQSSKPDIYTVSAAIVLLSIALAISCRGYFKLRNELKDLP